MEAEVRFVTEVWLRWRFSGVGVSIESDSEDRCQRRRRQRITEPKEARDPRPNSEGQGDALHVTFCKSDTIYGVNRQTLTFM